MFGKKQKKIQIQKENKNKRRRKYSVLRNNKNMPKENSNKPEKSVSNVLMQNKQKPTKICNKISQRPAEKWVKGNKFKQQILSLKQMGCNY